MAEGKFATSVSCMDGRIQIPLNKWIKENYSADFVDTITEPGVDKNIDFTDDFIFLCYLLGNDFLPNMPSIDIKNYGLDTLINCYTEVYKTTYTQLIVNNEINIIDCQKLIRLCGSVPVRKNSSNYQSLKY